MAESSGVIAPIPRATGSVIRVSEENIGTKPYALLIDSDI
eukprot:CAMPEP_0185749720 /NCGR_PEP_ID=MMETSP1174-20130828/8427_1 /TAXON_ID=35687 /ORGANISM="Dictyocha speculum, Strain CCMP1381" /LENGTH=39 /DNA_ID= /DNA_START= /DNA_END= /DNA_ORIENTATION=